MTVHNRVLVLRPPIVGGGVVFLQNLTLLETRRFTGQLEIFWNRRTRSNGIPLSKGESGCESRLLLGLALLPSRTHLLNTWAHSYGTLQGNKMEPYARAPPEPSPSPSPPKKTYLGLVAHQRARDSSFTEDSTEESLYRQSWSQGLDCSPIR